MSKIRMNRSTGSQVVRTKSSQTPNSPKVKALSRTVSLVTETKRNTMTNLSALLSQSTPIISKDNFSFPRKEGNTAQITREMATEILQVLQADKFSILKKTLFSVTLEENPVYFCDAIANVFSSEKLFALADSLITDELSQSLVTSSGINTMFRLDSPATAIISAIFRRDCHSFLASICKPIIRKVRKLRVELEIDPLKVSSEEIQCQNIAILQDLVHVLIGKVHKHLSSLTPQVIELCKLILEKSNEHVEGSGNLMVCSFIFLRFLCPALVSPGEYDVNKRELSRSQKRALILIVKVIQNVVNGVEFDGSKEPYMKCMNVLVQRHHSEIIQSIEELVNQPVQLKAKRRHIQLSFSSPALRDYSDNLMTLCQYFIEFAPQSMEKIGAGPKSIITQELNSEDKKPRKNSIDIADYENDEVDFQHFCDWMMQNVVNDS